MTGLDFSIVTVNITNAVMGRMLSAKVTQEVSMRFLNI